MGRYTLLTLLGSLIWCFAFAVAGYAVPAGVVVIAVLLPAHRVGGSRRSA